MTTAALATRLAVGLLTCGQPSSVLQTLVPTAVLEGEGPLEHLHYRPDHILTQPSPVRPWGAVWDHICETVEVLPPAEREREWRRLKLVAAGHSEEEVAYLLGLEAASDGDGCPAGVPGDGAGSSTQQTSTSFPDGPSALRVSAPLANSIPVSCFLSYARNGNLAMVRVETVREKDTGADLPPRDNMRGEIETFSPGARGRLLRLLNSIDREAVPSKQVWFGTLTYHHLEFRPEVLDKHLKCLVQRSERRWGKLPIVHKLELQKRGAPHYHLLIIVPRELAGRMRDYRRWLAQAWHDVVNYDPALKQVVPDPAHLKAGTQLDEARSWSGVNAYVGKYMSKELSQLPVDPITGEVHKLGRWWGVHRRDLLPIAFEHVPLSASEAFRVRRVLHKLAKRKVSGGEVKACSAFVLSANCKRIAEWVRSLDDPRAREWRESGGVWDSHYTDVCNTVARRRREVNARRAIYESR